MDILNSMDHKMRHTTLRLCCLPMKDSLERIHCQGLKNESGFLFLGLTVSHLNVAKNLLRKQLIGG